MVFRAGFACSFLFRCANSHLQVSALYSAAELCVAVGNGEGDVVADQNE